MPYTFAIINFVETNEIEVVPLTWIKETGCLWPPLKAINVQKMVKKLHKPSDDWICHEIRILGKYETFDLARRHLKKAEEESDLTSDPDCGKGKRRIFPSRLIESSDEDTGGLTFTESTGIVVPTIEATHCSRIPLPESSVIDQPTNIDGTHDNGQSLDIVVTALHNLVKEVLVIKANQRLILQNQEEILNKICVNTAYHQDVREFQLGELPGSFPLSTEEDLNNIEVSLEDEIVKECLIKKMSSCGGKTVQETVKRIMNKLIADSLAQNYSWIGAKGKAVFSHLKIKEIIFAAVRKNPLLTGSVTDHDMEFAIKNWLRHAKARHSSQISKMTVQSQSLI